MGAIARNGANLAALTSVGSRLYGDRSAIHTIDQRISYRELSAAVDAAAMCLYSDHSVRRTQRIAVAAKNSVQSVVLIFALSRLGANVYLVDGNSSDAQLSELQATHHFDKVLRDSELTIDPAAPNIKLPRGGSARLTILTSGTTGASKAASRKTGVGSFLPAFVSLLVRLQLTKYKRLYIATPLYHGFGISALIVAIAVGSENFMTPSFDAPTACNLILTNKVEAITLVPTILQRLIDTDREALTPLRCIITGGAPLSATLATNTLDALGDVLFNLYGTSEGGVAIMSAPSDLRRFPNSIGKPLAGVKVRNGGGTSQVEIRSRWSVGGAWTATGDNGYVNDEGYWFLVGRIDDMIVSGGENVYPIELERIISTHPAICEAVVIGVADDDFGERLKAFVTINSTSSVNEVELKEWLIARAQRHLIPREIVILSELPYNAAGKVDRHALS